MERFVNHVLRYLTSIEIDLKLIKSEDPEIESNIRTIIKKHSNNFIKKNNHKINAINELKEFVTNCEEHQMESLQKIMNPIISEVIKKHKDVQHTLSKLNRFSLNDLAMDYSQFIEFNEVWSSIVLTNIKDKKGGSKKDKYYTNQLSDDRKIVIDKLIKDGFKVAHIYDYLKRKKQVISLTEPEFRCYLNQYHSTKLDVHKRMTNHSNLKLTPEFIAKADDYIAQIVK
jgi:hypothetical protein